MQCKIMHNLIDGSILRIIMQFKDVVDARLRGLDGVDGDFQWRNK